MANSQSTQTTGKTLDRSILVAALLMIIYHFLVVWFPVFNPVLHQNFHLGFSLLLLFAIAIRGMSGRRTRQVILTLGLVIGLVCVGFIHFHYERLSMWAGFPEPVDRVVGIALTIAVVFLTWREWGFIFPTLFLISLSYAFFGHYLTGPMGHPHLEPDLILSNLGIGLEGIYGMMLNASANLIFLFIVFGSLFEVVGIDRFFIELGSYFGGKLKGGAAHTAIVSSSFVGMCTGSAPANVALTGSYTIPLMKKSGYRGKYAAAIEAAASSGGQLTPPIMGVAIFIMAGFLGIGYGRLMLTAFIPAIFYYAIVIFGAVVIASRENIPKLEKKIDKELLVKNGPVFLVPMGILTTLLILHYSPAYSAFFAIAAMLVIAMLRSETRPNLQKLLEGLVKGAAGGASLGVACAAIGMFMKMLTMTGAASKLANLSQLLAGGSLTLGLVYAMCLSIILGCAMPIVVAYVICAIVVAPVLVEMGLTQITAHFFVFYFAVLSAVTPPVAAAAMVGSKIAGSGYIRTGLEAFKMIVPFFVVPFFLVENPIVMGQPQPFIEAVTVILALVIACSSLLAFSQGFLLAGMSLVERFGFLVAAVFATAYGLSGYVPVLIAALILFSLLLYLQLRKKVKPAEIGLVG